ncbi:TonB-dependent receptor domain-containing protein [Sphingobacterium paludis]|uniref:Outer membrane receptor for ferrienterochelin and colicin n=1 Tax=Sphingobacterium paludis TaxID=1476465 RepID=A0A4R7D7M6_9SPHI|nr:TonB-dependent receptor [Sphingobacterium paludis]TDS15885.1 outer membrane receptor for ferrienterochelin and colicin [Sphingobacterium paludis]
MHTLFKAFLILAFTLIYTATFSQQRDTIQFEVAGNCGLCKQRIEKAAKIKGVDEAVWDMETNMATVYFHRDKTSSTAIKQAIADVGHDTDDIRAQDDVYAKLHECCLYERLDSASETNSLDDHENHDHEHTVRGVVVQENGKGELTPIAGVNISWQENPQKTVQTNENGVFDIVHQTGYANLIVSFVGMKADTILVKNLHEVLVIHAKDNVLAEVVVSRKQRSNYIAKLSPNRIEMITAKELFKAACCDLSESFETNASVDVVSSDAVTGAKQIQLLGLSGVYTQLTVENLPGPRGFAAPLGLNSMAGPWIESIQISKGMGSVANGFESMSGQINVELKKPHNTDQLYFNAYANNMGRTDVNLNLAKKINDKWSVGLLLHDNFMYNKSMNFSNNGFRDMPVGNVFSGVNRWHYENGKGLIAQFGIKYLSDDRTGGEIDFNERTDKLTTNRYGLGFDIDRIEGFAKIGYVFPNHKLRSIGLQVSGAHYRQDSYFGLTTYNSEQRSGYANLLYQDVLGSVMHKYRAGLSLSYDKYNEQIVTNDFRRTEAVSGAFLEYTFAPNEKFDAVLGIRQDYNSIYGWFTTPRAVLRYAPAPNTTFRLSSGRGQRTANIFAENMGIFASSRAVDYAQLASSSNTAYGLKPEVSWNTGLTFDQDFQLFGRESGFSVELFHNNFSNQVVVDWENPRAVSFYNLDGKSFSNSLQADFRFMPIAHLETRFAYRLLDVQTDYQAGRLQKPLTAKHRGFVNMAYNLHSGWSFDYTLNVVGKKRLPSTVENPAAYQLQAYSDAYVTMNAQVSKSLGKEKNLTVYLGGENLTNFFQKNPILAFDEPFGQFFDTNLLWGPIAGRLFYAGLRYTIK